MTISGESILIKGISHDIRREILRLIDQYPMTFTELLNHFDISTGKLNYHLSQIDGFIEKQNDSALYQTTSLGKKALKVLYMIDNEMETDKDQKLLKNAYLSQKNTGLPLLLKGISIMIILLSLFIIIHGSMLIGLLLTFNELQGSIIVLPIIIALLGIEIAGLIWLLQVRKSSPAFLAKMNKHFQEEN